ncbi:unnamed protein product, partial [Laminaria digitata]
IVFTSSPSFVHTNSYHYILYRTCRENSQAARFRVQTSAYFNNFVEAGPRSTQPSLRLRAPPNKKKPTHAKRNPAQPTSKIRSSLVESLDLPNAPRAPPPNPFN